MFPERAVDWAAATVTVWYALFHRLYCCQEIVHIFRFSGFSTSPTYSFNSQSLINRHSRKRSAWSLS